MKKGSNDLSEGSIIKNIVLFALPILMGQVFQNLYNSVDSIVVGKFVGVTALAAVTASADISQLIVGFFTGLSTGAGILFARFFGAKDNDNLHRSIHTGLLFSIIAGVVMALSGAMLTPAMLRMVDCPQEVFDEASTYLIIYFVGVLFTSIYNVASGVLRAVGDSRTPFIYLVITSFTNIVLDMLFVIAFDMGVTGVAVATIMSQLLSVVLIIRKMLLTDDAYKLVLKDLKIEPKLLKQVLLLGLPAAIQSSIICFSNLFVQKYQNAFGPEAMAGIGASKKLDKYIGIISMSLGQALATFVSQNIGANKYDRVFKGIRYVFAIAFVCIAVIGIPMYFYADVFMQLFSSDAETISYGVAMMQVMIPLYYFQSLNSIGGNMVRGFGKSVVVTILSITGMVVIRQIFLAISMDINHVVENVYYGFPVGWMCSGIFVMVYYFVRIRIPFYKKQKQLQG